MVTGDDVADLGTDLIGVDVPSDVVDAVNQRKSKERVREGTGLRRGRGDGAKVRENDVGFSLMCSPPTHYRHYTDIGWTDGR